jgi:hypothetical protein
MAMSTVEHSVSPGSCVLLAALMAIAAPGCSGQQSPEQRLQKALQEAGEQKEKIFPLAGRVSVDGMPPAYDPRYPVIVMLIDREKSNEPTTTRRFIECDPEGRFSFSSYDRDDGVKPGRYLVAIAKLERTAVRAYVGPDQFHNRYNDPDKNAQDGTFRIDHNAPGKRDYDFHLTIAGNDPVEKPGPHAITQIP